MTTLEFIAHVKAGAVWPSSTSMGRHVLCVRDGRGIWRPTSDDVTEDCHAARDAGLIRFDGLLWHVTDAGADYLANSEAAAAR